MELNKVQQTFVFEKESGSKVDIIKIEVIKFLNYRQLIF